MIHERHNPAPETFTPEEYAYLRARLEAAVTAGNNVAFTALLSNNFNVVLAALKVAANTSPDDPTISALSRRCSELAGRIGPRACVRVNLGFGEFDRSYITVWHRGFGEPGNISFDADPDWNAAFDAAAAMFAVLPVALAAE